MTEDQPERARPAADREPSEAVPEGGRAWPPAGPAWGTLVTVALGVIMVGLDGTVVSVANPAIGRDPAIASLADLQWITNSYLLALAVALIPGGKLGDRCWAPLGSS